MLSVTDKSYLGQLVSAQTGLDPSQADKRVSDIFSTAPNSIPKQLEKQSPILCSGRFWHCSSVPSALAFPPPSVEGNGITS